MFEDTSGFRTGFKGLYTEVTYGVAYKPCNGLIIRPSIRYDNNSKSTGVGRQPNPVHRGDGCDPAVVSEILEVEPSPPIGFSFR